MSDEPVGVLIIGAGASGAAFAWSIAETGMSVLCLEQGPWVKQSEYPGNGMDWESRAPTEWSPNPNIRRRLTDYPVNDEASAISPLMFNGVGGSTILWTAHFPRFTPNDFRVRSLDGVADDWPISYYDLEPYYATNDRMMGVSGLAGDPAYPYHEPPLPMLPFGKLGETLAGGFEKLGWHWWPSDAAIISREYEGRAACINLGTCGSGCAQGAKASTDITYWPVAQRRGVRIRTGCRVKEITLGPDGLADGVLYYDETGTLQEQKAEIVVVACNGVGTSRLLLNSKSERFPDGLANSSGQVGKNLMFHPAAFVTGVFDEEFHGRRGPVSATLWSHQFYHTNRSRGFLRGFSFEAVRGFGPAQTAMMGMAYGRVPWGAGHHKAYAKLFGHTATLVCLTDDLPEEHNRVTLDPVLKDSNGIPAPRVSYTLRENPKKIRGFAAERGDEVMRAAGAHDVMIDPQMRNAGWHLMGTARMGRDPKTSVVNEWGRAHDVKNLFVIDGSVFVTGAAVNPTSTIRRSRSTSQRTSRRTSRTCLTDMSEPSAALGDSSFLRAMLNLLIPPEGRMPGAGDLDLWPAVAGPLGQNPAAFASLTAGLDAVRGAALARHPGGLAALAPAAAMEVVQSVTAERPEFMPALARATSMAYYQQPAVLTALGEPARPPFPEGFELEPISAEWLALLERRAQRLRTPSE